jgi:hypothetical protein
MVYTRDHKLIFLNDHFKNLGCLQELLIECNIFIQKRKKNKMKMNKKLI